MGCGMSAPAKPAKPAPPRDRKNSFIMDGSLEELSVQNSSVSENLHMPSLTNVGKHLHTGLIHATAVFKPIHMSDLINDHEPRRTHARAPRVDSPEYLDRIDSIETQTIDANGITLRFAYASFRGFYPDSPDKDNQVRLGRPYTPTGSSKALHRNLCAALCQDFSCLCLI
jgi:hypothetical protein